MVRLEKSAVAKKGQANKTPFCYRRAIFPRHDRDCPSHDAGPPRKLMGVDARDKRGHDGLDIEEP
ncbi:hypothetical protein GJ654_08275 [Rhodoblastus acidophilus]|uniref:Uncharacterized protein n=1 Tax=Rhodoblastus acidophilus TaxID=1074 RepID=A0A6N8DK80_RHOAC|nr:hypothetical protein [Rhodoblastus acidophilus]MCW2273865.1 hypothetical protein [Rhodoblastus acidophilus]MTV30990.1 hypothetical protein [Rhodoblastus acidophilus]